jgi:hypothetical protein
MLYRLVDSNFDLIGADTNTYASRPGTHVVCTTSMQHLFAQCVTGMPSFAYRLTRGSLAILLFIFLVVP